MKRILQEPLLHFLVIGAILFLIGSREDAGVGTAAGGATALAAPNPEIVVTEGRIRSLAENFARVWQRPPTPDELRGLVDDHIREEVLYREALALGLDRDDTIIRRRMRQKMEFLNEDIADQVAPTEEQLAAYLAAHPDQFRVDAVYSFRQVYLNPERRGENVQAEAAELIDALNSPDAGIDPAEIGDSLLLEPAMEGASERDVARLFGTEFAEGLRALPIGTWAGPVGSGYGIHVVRVEAKTEGRLPALDEVRDAVAREWSAGQRRAANEAFFKALKERYSITVETGGAAVDDDGRDAPPAGGEGGDP